MNQARARKHLIQYGICLSRYDGPAEERWLTTPSNNPDTQHCFATIRAAVEYWDEQARWLAFDTAITDVTLAQERARDAADLVVDDGKMEKQHSIAPALIRASFPHNWKEIVKAWVDREGSIAGIDISQVLTHARTQQEASCQPRGTDADHVYGVAQQRCSPKS